MGGGASNDGDANKAKPADNKPANKPSTPKAVDKKAEQQKEQAKEKGKPLASSAPPQRGGNGGLHRSSVVPLSEASQVMAQNQREGDKKRLERNLAFDHRRASNAAGPLAPSHTKVKKLIHAGDDDFEDDDYQAVDWMNGANASTNNIIRRKDERDMDENGGRFGRQQVNKRDVLMGNQTGGNMDNAARQNIVPEEKGSPTRHDAGDVVEQKTVNGRAQKHFANNDADIDEGPAKTISAFGGVERNARKAQMKQDLQRRQSIREKASGGGTAASDAKANQNVHVVNGTPKMKQLLEQVRQYRQSMRNKKEVSDSDISEMHAIQEHYSKIKLHVAQQIAALGPKVDIVGRQNKDQVVEFCASIIAESDGRAGNVELLQIFFKHLHTIEWHKVILEDQWVETCALEGFPRFLDVLLQVPHLADDPEAMFSPVGVLAACIDNKRVRIPLCIVVCKYWAVMRIGEFKKEMKELWQELFANVASHKRAIANEDRSGRMTLLQKILGLTDFIDLDVCAIDDSDKQSILSRCVLEGDANLLQAIVRSTLSIKYNMILPSGDTVLTLAVRQGQKLMVDTLLGCKGVDPMVEVNGEGNALDIARATKASTQIVSAIDNRMRRRGSTMNGTLSGKSGDGSLNGTLNGTMGSMRNLNGTISGGRDKDAWKEKEPRLPDFLKVDEATALKEELLHLSEDWHIDTEERPVIATEKVVEVLDSVEEYWQKLTEAKNNLLKGDDELAADAFQQLEDGLGDFKHSAAIKLQHIGARISVEGKPGKDKVIKMVERLLGEQEIPGNLELVRTLMYRIITVDFSPLVTEKQWALHAAQSGLPETLDSVLRVPKMWKDDQEVVELAYDCVHHPTQRINLCLILLKHGETLRIGTYKEHLRQLWDEVWEGLCAKKPSNQFANEDRSKRQELMYRMAHHRHIQLRYDFEMGGGQTYFSRACREGDIELLQVFLDLVMVDLNRVSTNKSSPLMQAVIGNQVAAVKLLLKESDIDVNYRSPHGTALELATKMNKDPHIQGALKNWRPKAN